MLKGLDIVALAQKIDKQSALKRDFITSAKSLAMTDRGDLIVPTPSGALVTPVTDYAHGQISAYTDIPMRYYRRMRESDPALLQHNVNTWLGRRADSDMRMVRTLDGSTRALLSNGYRRIDNAQVARAVLPALADLPGLQPVALEVTDRRLHMAFTLPRVAGEVGKGDVVQIGVAIRNSEIGAARFVVTPLIYRLVCLNGLIMPDGGLKQRHVGRRVEDTEELDSIEYKDDTLEADDRALALKARDAVTAALSEATFSKHLERMRALADMPITAVDKAIDRVAKIAELREPEKASMLQSLLSSGLPSAWGLVNAVTAQAHGATDFERSMELADAGGKLLSLAPSEWTQVLAA
jgi:hypothetical protein